MEAGTMFIALDLNGNRLSSVETDLHALRKLSLDGQILCPDCGATLGIRAGESRRPHFYHPAQECEYTYHEPETEEHITGKWLLWMRLRALFPQSTVELECPLTETRQRPDILVTHVSGARIAVEYQCYRISGQLWRERHDLYQEAGIPDVWILGTSVHQLGIVDGQHSKFKHRLCDLERTLHQQQHQLVYLEPSTQNILFLKNGLAKGQMLIHPIQSKAQLQVTYLRDDMWWVDELDTLIESERQKQDFLKMSEVRRRQEQEALEALREEQRKQLKLDQEMARERTDQRCRERFTELMQYRGRFTEAMTTEEELLFRQLSAKHKYHKDNFPAILHIEDFIFLKDRILTPPQLWQLWFYDRYIFGAARYSKLWLPRAAEAMARLNLIRTSDSTQSSVEQFQAALKCYCEEVLEPVGIVRRIGKNYYKILATRIPVFEERKSNVLIQMTFECPECGWFTIRDEFNEKLKGGRKRV
jgi:competence CoiA-like predicted nuclease